MYDKVIQKNKKRIRELYELKSKVQKTREENIRIKTKIKTIENTINNFIDETKMNETNIIKLERSIENYTSLVDKEEKINNLLENLI